MSATSAPAGGQPAADPGREDRVPSDPTVIAPASPFRGRRAGRVMLVLGGLAVAAGTALCIGFVLWGMTLDAAAVARSVDPIAAAPAILGVPQPLLGLALVVLGSLGAALGAATSRAARRRGG